jgi:hypothetical protein
LVGIIAFSVAMALVAVVAYAHAMRAGTLSVLGLLGDLIILFFAGLFIATVLPGIPRTRSGADFVSIGDQGLQLTFPSGRSLFLGWTEPKMSFELYDASSAPQASVLVSSPYFLRARRTESTLSREAYAQILAAARAHGLVVKSAKGSGWIYPSTVAPMIHYVRAPATPTLTVKAPQDS